MEKRNVRKETLSKILTISHYSNISVNNTPNDIQRNLKKVILFFSTYISQWCEALHLSAVKFKLFKMLSIVVHLNLFWY